MIVSRVVGTVAVLMGCLAGTTVAVNIETVPVGNPGNPADTRYGSPGYGSVGYTYNIGKYEVTAGQYCEFLNAVAKTDTYGLYHTEMWSNTYGCKIQQSGSSGSYTYTVAADWANRPVNCVSWGDAARFTNWLHNGQPTGSQDLSTTEDGAYYLNGTTSDTALVAVTRKADWKWAITSEDEWYKAAYHKNDGVTGNYWDYPTGSDSGPSNDLADPDPGNSATFNDGSSWTLGLPYVRTEVGEHENSSSPYGTFDQGGNVWEVMDSTLDDGGSTYHVLRGGAFFNFAARLSSAERYPDDPAYYHPDFGFVSYSFRVVQVPEPVTMFLMGLGGLGLLRRRSSH